MKATLNRPRLVVGRDALQVGDASDGAHVGGREERDQLVADHLVVDQVLLVVAALDPGVLAVADAVRGVAQVCPAGTGRERERLALEVGRAAVPGGGRPDDAASNGQEPYPACVRNGRVTGFTLRPTPAKRRLGVSVTSLGDEAHLGARAVGPRPGAGPLLPGSSAAESTVATLPPPTSRISVQPAHGCDYQCSNRHYSGIFSRPIDRALKLPVPWQDLDGTAGRSRFQPAFHDLSTVSGWGLPSNQPTPATW